MICSVLVCAEGIDCLDIVDDNDDRAGEDENEGNQTESANGIKANKAN
jgi:hypothetical protein